MLLNRWALPEGMRILFFWPLGRVGGYRDRGRVILLLYRIDEKAAYQTHTSPQTPLSYIIRKNDHPT